MRRRPSTSAGVASCSASATGSADPRAPVNALGGDRLLARFSSRSTSERTYPLGLSSATGAGGSSAFSSRASSSGAVGAGRGSSITGSN
eukprot:8735069-Pyramimonas_sp.AAC.1